MKPDQGNRRNSLAFHLVFSLLSIGIYGLLVWQLSGPVLAWLALQRHGAGGIPAAVKYDGRNAAYHYVLGRHYRFALADADAARATAHFRTSLELNPLQPGVWMDISKALQEEGRKEEAEHAFERAVRLSPNNAELQWEAGTFWLMNNMIDKAVGALREVVRIDPSRQVRVYDLCWKIGLGNGYIKDHVVPKAYSFQQEYLKYLMAANRVEESAEVWNGLGRDYLEKDLFLSYVNFLISRKSYDRAWSAWQEIMGMLFDQKGIKVADESGIWNQSFEQEMMNGGFDWVVREAAGAKVFIDESTRMIGNRSLGVFFDGRQNPDIVIARQVVRISPEAHYSLSAHIKTESLTTANGIFLQVRGDDCQGLDRSSEVVTGSNFWREISVDFETASSCTAVSVMIRRARSAKLDNKIEGTAWIDGVILKQLNSRTNISREL